MPSEGLQRYQIMERLGSGSQGHSYRAIDRETHEDVAIKVLSLGGATEWKAFELFEREAEVLAGLRHRGIPRYRDYFASEESGDYFLVMDLVVGHSLADELGATGRFDEARLRRLMRGVLEILEYLHTRSPQVIHRDIKPANIVVGEDDSVHLVDFGGVRVLTRLEGGSTMIGTFGYMAPEQLHGDAGPGVDLYALGATIVALATGRAADELPHVGLAIDLDELVLPERLRPVLRALLEPDPRDRVRSVAEARALLDGRSTSNGAAPSAKARSTSTSTPTPTSSPTGPETPATALAVPGLVQELAQTPKPMSIFVWLFALFGAGALIVIEYALLPIVYLFLRAVADNKNNKGEAIDDDKAGITSLRDLRSSTRRQRELVAHVIQGTSPLRDDPPALPPGADDR
ncbi:serine/threonine kinase [Enhygromyxa salina]|uniref:non-specific serine/threonine protein kinase n=1 Tax=Enhygromyxa salina TaxID=215803 RepID=A0A0C2CZR6_9BACT|nr:serine/threonine-protein kinase [Enhygromyxa salina]KIG13362.1 serine/threonine kinase [Enhygromyxa salina]